MSERAKPLPQGVPVYEHGWSVYPDRIRQPMDDGQVIDYVRMIQQPAPVFRDALDKFTLICFGYKYRRRKRHGL